MEKVEKLFAKVKDDEELFEKLFATESAEEVKELAAEVGIELTVEEVKGAGKLILNELEDVDGDGELSEDDLDNVAGGFSTVSQGGLVSPLVGQPIEPGVVGHGIQPQKRRKEDVTKLVQGWF